MALPTIINIRSSETPSKGYLSVFETTIDISFPIERFYYIHDVPIHIKRGGHAHKSLSELLFCPYGSVSIYLSDGTDSETLLLKSPDEGVVITPGLWIEMIWNSENAILCAAASEHYNRDEGIYAYDEFVNWIKKNKQNDQGSNNPKYSDISQKIITSANVLNSPVSNINDIFTWIETKNATTKVDIHKITLSQSDSWYYDKVKGVIRNENGSFFEIAGIQVSENGNVISEQPIICQPEIGYLGIICKEIDGIIHFLMQAKIEPGNINKVQISPTIQATKSNFTQMHGGNKPPYLDYFINANSSQIVVDQIQSEQSSRFYKKRNRNIVILIDEDIKILPSHRWMTLGQIKELMKHDNLVNMDTRTVVSCLPIISGSLQSPEEDRSISRIYHYFNNYKMFHEKKTEFIPLHLLSDWNMYDNEIVCKQQCPFKVIFCDISIEGREVRRWTQPLFESTGSALFGLICCDVNGVLKFLVRATPEIGCFDALELGPSIQLDFGVVPEPEDRITKLFLQNLTAGKGILHDVLLSEEGGRFYHEENRNVIMILDRTELNNLPEGYFLVTYNTLNTMVQTNNCLNIQLRNLLSLLPM